MVTVDDSVWDEYLKTKSIPDFDNLSLIISNASANGSGMLNRFDAEHITNQDDTFSRETNIEAEAINNTTAEVDMEPLMVELEKILELDEDFVIEAVEYLSSDKKMVNLFYEMKDNLRRR
ncbi:hypothetical protein HHK36_010763 [Tetracentron sinense]|uniref:Uncharacterized protein n=1 Tax=Tetracentron sinense TaxID=13715 RepID=A0A834Z7Y7_TETSI|nr:hypothetical protein HHK36_010763 [Tetracentron sinense]